MMSEPTQEKNETNATAGKGEVLSIEQRILKLAPAFKPPTCRLEGEDGNAFAIMGKVRRALFRGGYSELAPLYLELATSGDYSNLLRVSMCFVKEEVDEEEE